MIIQSISANAYKNAYCFPKKKEVNTSNINFTGACKAKILDKSKAIQKEAENYLYQGKILRDKMLECIEDCEHTSEYQSDPGHKYDFNFENGEDGKETLNFYSKETGKLAAKTDFYYWKDEPFIDSIEVCNQQTKQTDRYCYRSNCLTNVHQNIKNKNGKVSYDKYILYLSNNDYKVYTNLQKNSHGVFSHGEQFNFRNDELAVYKKYGKMVNDFQETVLRIDFQ